MDTKKKYRGIIVPVVTPLTKEYKLDAGSVEKLFHNFYKHDVCPFILGTTGESASLPLSVKLDYLVAAEKNKKNNTILYAGISSNVLQESIDFAKHCADHGVDAVAATLPSYYTLSENQVKEYFEELADSVPLPLIIYNIPATTHMSIPLEIIEELSYHPNIVATKDSERNEERLIQSQDLWANRSDFGHFLGWAAKSAEGLIGGSDGLIPSTGNLVPKLYADMLQAVERDDFDEAFQLQQFSDTVGDLYQKGKTLGQSLWALKVLMRENGLCQDVVMPPLQPMSPGDEQELIQSFKEIY